MPKQNASTTLTRVWVFISLRRVATKDREEIKRTTMQKMARRHNKEGGNHLDQESNRQKTMEDIDGGLHPAVNGQSLGER